jgi:hypothetical protein
MSSYPFRLVALVTLYLHALKANILSSHQDSPVQYEFSRTRHPLYIILHTNKHPRRTHLLNFFTTPPFPRSHPLSPFLFPSNLLLPLGAVAHPPPSTTARRARQRRQPAEERHPDPVGPHLLPPQRLLPAPLFCAQRQGLGSATALLLRQQGLRSAVTASSSSSACGSRRQSSCNSRGGEGRRSAARWRSAHKKPRVGATCSPTSSSAGSVHGGAPGGEEAENRGLPPPHPWPAARAMGERDGTAKFG